jgi:hypothetical protein
MSTEKTDEALFFPSEGTFSTVVPLSKINDELASSRNTSTASEPSEAVERVNVHAVKMEPAPEELKQQGQEQHEHEETTLVPMRASHVRSLRTTPALRPQAVRRSWLVTTVALVLSSIAGLVAGAYLIRAKQSVESQSNATLIEAAAPTAEVATQVPDSQPAKTTPNPQTSQSAPQLLEPSATTEHDRTTEPESSSSNRRALNASTRIDIAERVEHTARLERPSRTPGGASDNSPATKPAQRDAASTQRARIMKEHQSVEHSSAAVAPPRSFPVSSPPPSAKSRKVIQWP